MDTDFLLSNWIWINDWERVKRDSPCIVYFRKEFHKGDRLQISANCRYKLYINGVFVQEGPQKGTIEATYADTAGIAGFLRDGKNTAAVQVLYYPENSAKRNDSLYYSPFPCLYVEDLREETTSDCTGDAGDKELDGKSGWKYYVADHIQLRKEPFNPASIHGSESV
ncbi:MAG: hypothetical protein Q4C91_04705 [Eubacteriales bacterium]|nr:hypothetical protein [Eubacteriales bacterium]